LDAEIERCDGSDGLTQQLLGDLISKPKLTEKLLAKPPFRFLHDIIMEVMRVTGFGTGLYSGAELNSGEVNEKAAKLLFLEKIIRLVGAQLNTLVEAKPAKIVAGLDPSVTNNFLQLLAIAAKNVPDSTSAVRLVLEQLGEGGSGGGAEEPAPAATRQPEARREESKPSYNDSQPTQQEERSKPEERTKPSRQSQQQAEPKESRPPQREVEEPRRELFDDKPMVRWFCISVCFSV
jgi:TRAF3-interacting protein 1